ncbi:MAG: alkaline phosphatase family protein [bacterium]
MELPNYKNGSIVNLMSSIGEALGTKCIYDELSLLRSKDLKDSKNIVLIVLDGLGYEYLKDKNSILNKGLKGKITSVFPPTTASAITTFVTGLAPQQHAFTGWFMHLKELGTVATTLLFNPRIGGQPFTTQDVEFKDILNLECFSERIEASSYLVTPEEIMGSDFTKANSKKSEILGYQNLDGFFSQIKKATNSHDERKYIFAYWPEFDSLSHEYGINSEEVKKHFWEIDKKISLFIDDIKGTKSTLIITADHGLIDTTKERTIELEDHPKLKECLTLPFCGEARLVYCYVHPSKAKQFEAYVKNNLNKFCNMRKSEELINNNYFGLFEPNPKLIDRVGDYALIMKENYVFTDKILNKREPFHIGNHGGVSKEEVFIPLVVFNE